MTRMRTCPTTAVIVTYNAHAYISAALDETGRARDERLLETIVVDNASADDTAALVRERYPWVRVIESGANLGYGRGCNAGLAAVETPYVLFLNPDAVLPTASLRTLITFLDEHPRAAVAAPATKVYGGAALQFAGGLPTPANILVAAALRSQPSSRRVIQPGTPPFQTDWLAGGILLARCEAIRGLGGFDPRFFLYFEETDLCKRAIESGHELWAVGTATASHAGAQAAKSTGRRLYHATIAEHYFRSRFYYLVKHFGWAAAIGTDMLEIAILALRSLAKKLLGRSGADLSERLSGPVMRLPTFPKAAAPSSKPR
jgi:GT2 family glycosyltransferase